MAKEIGYGIVGLGVGKSHVSSALKAKGVKFVALCDSDQEALNKVGDEQGIDPANRFTRLEDMLNRSDIEAVSICTPSGMHMEHAIQALRAGKHVLVEKPLEIQLDRIDKMNQVAVEENRILASVFQNRLSAGNRKIKETVESGRMGKLITANFHVKWYRNDDYYLRNGGWRGTWAMDGGGALMNQSVHTVDLMQWFMGPVKSVFAKAGTFNHNIETEDTAVAVISFENGAIGTFIGTTCAYPGLEVSSQIHGSTGSVYAKNAKIEVFKMSDDDKERTGEARILAEFGANKGEQGSGSSDPMAIGLSGHAGQVQDFIHAVIEGRQPLSPGTEGRAAVEIILAIYESSRTGKEVFLKH